VLFRSETKRKKESYKGAIPKVPEHHEDYSSAFAFFLVGGDICRSFERHNKRGGPSVPFIILKGLVDYLKSGGRRTAIPSF